MFGEEENTPFDQSTTLERYKAEVLADQEKHDADPFLAVRVVLLIATGISAFTMPWMVSCFLALCWILVMVWPKST
jgi:hypothetical protein